LIQGYILPQLKQPPKINLVPKAARRAVMCFFPWKWSWRMDEAHNRNRYTETLSKCYQSDEITANK